MTLTLIPIRLLATVLALLGAAACSPRRDPMPPPPIGTQMTPVANDPDGRYPSGPPGSGFGDPCSILIRDAKTGAEYLLVQSSVARATKETPGFDSGAVVMALGNYAPRAADTLEGPPKGQFHVDCLKSRVVDPSTMIKQDAR